MGVMGRKKVQQRRQSERETGRAGGREGSLSSAPTEGMSEGDRRVRTLGDIPQSWYRRLVLVERAAGVGTPKVSTNRSVGASGESGGKQLLTWSSHTSCRGRACRRTGHSRCRRLCDARMAESGVSDARAGGGDATRVERTELDARFDAPVVIVLREERVAEEPARLIPTCGRTGSLTRSAPCSRRSS